MGEASRREPRSDSPMLLAVYLLAYLSVLARMVLRSPADGVIGSDAYGLMAAFLALGVAQVPLGRRRHLWTHIVLTLQCAVVVLLFRTGPTIDFYGILCVGLGTVAGRELPEPWDIAWLGILFATVVVGLILAFGPAPSVAYMPVYVAGILLVGLYGRATRRAQAARERSEELRTDLEEANRRLRAYADQAERAAAAQERARLSRELHDAATQTVFSMNLTAEAARMALAEDPDRVPSLLDRLQELARNALAELRSLVRDLRPAAVAEEGLVQALERHAVTRERRDCLRVTLAVRGEERGSSSAREALFGAAVEALNNVVKHAGVAEASVDLAFGDGGAVLLVSDAGAGFDVSAPRRPESFGLLSMKERLESIGGSLAVRSRPGAGTQVEVKLPLGQEEVLP